MLQEYIISVLLHLFMKFIAFFDQIVLPVKDIRNNLEGSLLGFFQTSTQSLFLLLSVFDRLLLLIFLAILPSCLLRTLIIFSWRVRQSGALLIAVR